MIEVYLSIAAVLVCPVPSPCLLGLALGKVSGTHLPLFLHSGLLVASHCFLFAFPIISATWSIFFLV